MKVELKLYKTFDADLIYLNSNGISISAMIKTALYHYVRGESVCFVAPQYKPFEIDGKKRHIHVVTNVDDIQSIEFLKKHVKPRQRSAFLRALLRECLTTQQISVYLREGWFSKENERAQSLVLPANSNIVELHFEERKHDYISTILKPAKKKVQITQENEKKKTCNQFGNISDLSMNTELLHKSESKKQPIVPDEGNKSKETVKKDTKINEDANEVEKQVLNEDFSSTNDNQDFDFFDDDEDEPTLDNALFAQFQNLTNG